MVYIFKKTRDIKPHPRSFTGFCGVLQDFYGIFFRQSNRAKYFHYLIFCSFWFQNTQIMFSVSMCGFSLGNASPSIGGFLISESSSIRHLANLRQGKF